MSNTNKNTRHAGNFGEEQHDGRNKVSVSPFVDALTEDYNRFGYTPEQVERGRHVKADFYRWIEDNSQAWNKGVEHLRELASEGKRISSQMLCEYIREHDFTDLDGKRVTLDNSYGPLIARKLAKDYPDLKRHFEFRRSVFDLLGVE